MGDMDKFLNRTIILWDYAALIGPLFSGVSIGSIVLLFADLLHLLN